jgi:SIR2-like domain
MGELIPSLAAPSKLAYRLSRLFERRHKVAFLLGSGITLPSAAHRGIPGTSEIISLIAARLGDSQGTALLTEATKGKTGGAAYQAAMQLLIECDGQSGVNEVISRAVLHAYDGELPPKNAFLDGLESCENNTEAWALNPAVTSLARIYNAFPDCVGPLLTSNFDPLIGIAVRKLGGSIEVFPISEDGSVTRFQTSLSNRRIIHFHGYWRGVDTLHTADQITRSRPKLAGDLRRLLGETNLVVLGYGAWQDVFMDTLSTIIAEGSVNGDVLWAFHEDDPKLVGERYKTMLERFAPQIGSRVILYGGVDANSLLPEVLERLNLTQTAMVPSSNAANFVSSIQARAFGIAPRMHDSFKDPGCDPPRQMQITGRAVQQR